MLSALLILTLVTLSQMVCAGLLVLAVFPAAYVELPTAQLLAKTPQHQLRVYTAGVS